MRRRLLKENDAWKRYKYIKFEAVSGTPVVLVQIDSNVIYYTYDYIEYSQNNGATWTKLLISANLGTTCNLGQLSNGSVLVRGFKNTQTYGNHQATISSDSTSPGIRFITSTGAGATGTYKCSGNLLSLVNIGVENYQNQGTEMHNKSAFAGLFMNNTSLEQASFIFPNNTIDFCYRSMFKGCTNLKKINFDLPAIDAGNCCYQEMFSGCTALQNSPILHIETFSGRNGSCMQMFYNCRNLVDVPFSLHITSDSSTYWYRFYQMFYGCTSLVKAPTIITDVTSFDSQAFNGMYGGCTNLNYIKFITPSGTISTNYFGSWVNGVASSGTFVKHPNATWTTGTSGIPSGWTVQTATS